MIKLTRRGFLAGLGSLAVAPQAVAGPMINSFLFAPPPAPSFRNTYSNAATQTSYSFATSDIGTEHDQRVVAVIAYASSIPGVHVNTVTIGGISATLAVNSGSTSRSAAIWYALVPTGATATIVVDWGVGTDVLGCIIHVFALYPNSSTPVDALGGNSGLTTVTLTDLAKTAGGFALFGTSTNSVDTVVVTHTGAETVTQHTATTFDSAITVTPHSFVVTATTTTDDFTATFSGADGIAFVGATWV